MATEYGSQQDYLKEVKEVADTRQIRVASVLREVFAGYIERREVEVIVFAGMSALELAEAISAHPIILKPLLACSNLAGRAIERDLDIKNLDTYEPRLDTKQAYLIAGYLKPFLPDYLELPTLTQIDRVLFIDKEIRKSKGRWEQLILTALNRYGSTRYKKRKFQIAGESFELDAASPELGDIQIGIDVKRIEARRDIHKRCDEIVNKAAKLKALSPTTKFGAVIYYPFVGEHVNIQSRLRSSSVDAVVFAAQTEASIETSIRLLLSMLEGTKA